MNSHWFLLLFILLLFLNCKDSMVKENSSLNNGSIVLVDSIELSTGSTLDAYVVGWDRNDNLYLGLSQDNRKLILWDSTGVILKIIAIPNEGPDRIRQVDKIGFGKRREVVIIAGDRVHALNIDTEEIMLSGNIDFEAIFPYPKYGHPLEFSDHMDRYVFTSVNDNFDSGTMSFFVNSQGLSAISKGGSKYDNFGFFSKDEIYRNKVVNSATFPCFDLFDKSVYYIRPLDRKKVSVYNSDEEAESIFLKNDRISELVYVDGSEISDQLKTDQLNSIYERIIVNDSLVVLQFKKNVEAEDLQLSIVEVNENPIERKKYLEVYGRKSRKKLCKDICMPEEIFKIWKIRNNNEIIMIRRYDIEDGVIKVYLGKINI